MTVTSEKVDEFISRWSASGGNEMANFQSFASELVQLLGVEAIKVADAEGQNNDYRFERPVTFIHTGRDRRGRIDLYRRGCFVLEAKQGTSSLPRQDRNQFAQFNENDSTRQQGHGRRGTGGFDDTMLRARNQADNYARAVAREDGWPPFLLVVDVGNVIEVYADFSKHGQGYIPFPDGNRYQIKLEHLRNRETRDLLRTIWNEPFSLDPALRAAEVTRDIAGHLAELGKSFEGQGHDSEAVARFLMRCLFSMFAEDVELIPKKSFEKKLEELRGKVEQAAPTLKSLWETMNTGGFSPVLSTVLMRFNGGLFKEADALPLNADQLELLILAAKCDWKQVEPAIFGTLLERALDKRQRHKLGAHYTPRKYVERLVVPTVIEPLREDWRDVQAAVQLLASQGKDKEAREQIGKFHARLCQITILDPACGSGNFLYVSLEMMKRLEGEVLKLYEEFGGQESLRIGIDVFGGSTVDPHQFLGIELNPWAANVAELVLWIGYLQWHYRTHGTAAPSEPVLRDFKNIRNADAVLEWSDRTPRVDADGNPVTRWDGVTTLRHPVTGEEVPDPAARVQVFDYAKPKPTQWPRAEFIVGNPPFIGNKRLRDNLGDGYVEALWKAYPKMPQSADLVMFWWEKAALAARAHDAKKGKGTRRFGLITTNSLRQTFNRRVLEPHLNDPKKPLSLLFAIPDHPWVDTLYGAAVRIAMTVGTAGSRAGRLLTIATESKEKSEADGRQVRFDHQIGKVLPNLQIGPDLVGSQPLHATAGLALRGVTLVGQGFIVSKERAKGLSASVSKTDQLRFRHFFNGKDVIGRPREIRVIDFFGLTEKEAKTTFPEAYQHLFDTVRPERLANNRKSYSENWWIFAEPRSDWRACAEGLSRFIATPMTAKHRFFVFLDQKVLPDQGLIPVGLEGSEFLAVLSSRCHLAWCLAQGGTLEDRPRYNNSRCFDPFPFPELTDDQRARLRTLGEELDAHRKRQQEAHPKLTLTQMYNVLEKLRAGVTIDGKDREIYDQGLIGILKDLHDQIDTAVAEAYGWPVDLSDEDILFRLVALNKERAEEEARGHIRWLRPDYQNPEGRQTNKGTQAELDVGPSAKIEKAPWPKSLPDQIAAVREALSEMGEATPDQIARRFLRARTTSVQPLLDSLAALGQAEKVDEGRYAA
ncbi:MULTISPECIES: class I SAM-dependent DNA methyltransferase [Marivita]|uniref:site-specific DNA-methyltransferase (adenine-specific) n=1 Tax=Marivita cryptomonadis TaxID=505252 RepID=A0A9Q2NYC7_9RHOB|nr:MULTISPECIES: DNA methyltransferase [Marivita]MCR9168733.1 class I SAM-dependent DNA methyltransferase [Paracoccaceae bacterium]MBM2321022.1 class I SAM-dependent DNA methyltransferase [Marivita cryptomonadis]MBM2330603.1 class I SAM-dependent DNA methyltransferase [Marivita cryptomonadis]MBM2340189.1 class I SAM-dependent DNA methyltransferase [Marivita cryptomonadis]MBM2344851.1 class I SAM-dependent DNA methyltransferase [Marivita cryptomonadis]